MPDQAAVSAHYNANNPGSLNLTDNLAPLPRHEGDTGSVESFWPCVGAERIVPDFNSLFPGAGQAAPFAGATRRCAIARKCTLEPTRPRRWPSSTCSARRTSPAHFTGTITNDFASEFDPFSPQFGEKFSAAQPAGRLRTSPARKWPRLRRPVGLVQRRLLLDLDGQSAQPERLHPADDDRLHERSGPDSRIRSTRADDHGSGLQPGLQQLLLRDGRSCPGRPRTWIRR